MRELRLGRVTLHRIGLAGELEDIQTFGELARLESERIEFELAVKF